jgi:UDP-N-acetylmuramoyl-tripeptide--D-alanyl-D-alanine ligase
VVEVGTNAPGEVARLGAIVEPDAVLVTSIAEEHLEGLGDLEGVLREEASIYDGVALGIAPAAQPEIAAAARARAARVVVAGLDDGDVRASSWRLDADGTGRVVVDGVEVHVPLRGAHNLRNAMLALAVARELGVTLAEAATGIRAMPAPSMRMAWETIGRAVVLNDAYNANPPSMRAAFELVAAVGDGRPRVAVLGTMLELGAETERLHREVARAALSGTFDVVAGVGLMADALAAEGRADDGTVDPRVVTAADAEELWPLLEPRLAPDALILLKGSRGMRLERLVPHLTAWAAR